MDEATGADDSVYWGNFLVGGRQGTKTLVHFLSSASET